MTCTGQRNGGRILPHVQVWKFALSSTLNEGATSRSIFPPLALIVYTICYYITPDHLDIQIFTSSSDCTRLDISLVSIFCVHDIIK